MGNASSAPREGPPRAFLFYWPFDDLDTLLAFDRRAAGRSDQIVAVNVLVDPSAARDARVFRYPTLVLENARGAPSVVPADTPHAFVELDDWMQEHVR